MIAAWRLRNNRDGFAVLVALGFIGTITVLRQLFGNLDDWGPSVRRVVAFRVDLIAYGFLLYMVVLHHARRASRWRAALCNPAAAAILFVVAASLAGGLTWRIETAHSHAAETLFPFAAAGFGISAILLAYSVRHAFQRSPGLSACCGFLGRVSYSLYLFHLGVAMTIAPRLAGLPLGAQVAVYLSICIALSALFYHFFERPILAMRPGYRQADKPAATGATPLAAPAKSAA